MKKPTLYLRFTDARTTAVPFVSNPTEMFGATVIQIEPSMKSTMLPWKKLPCCAKQGIRSWKSVLKKEKKTDPELQSFL